jgi:hypothetical protein
MTTESGGSSFYRRLPWSVVVRLDGYYDDADEPDPAVEDPDHPPGRVIVELPDFLADGLAHMIELVWDIAEHLTGDGPADGPARDLAEALHDAVASQAQPAVGEAERIRPWPPPWFGAVRAGRPDTAASSEELLADGFGR